MRRRNLVLGAFALGALALGLATLTLAAHSEAGPQRSVAATETATSATDQVTAEVTPAGRGTVTAQETSDTSTPTPASEWTSLSGGIPAELAGLTQLEGLFLYQNKLTGSIPAELGGLANLASLYLSENEMDGLPAGALRAVASNDLATLELPSCPLPPATLSYDSYDTTGAVTTAGSYSFLTRADDGTMTAVTTYEALRDGTTTSVRLHSSDGGGASRAKFYDAVEARDRFEWRAGDNCWVRYWVEGVAAGTSAYRDFAIKPYSYAATGCPGVASDGAYWTVSTAVASGSHEFVWSPPDLTEDDLTAPVRHGVYLLIPSGWEGQTEPVSALPPPADAAGSSETNPTPAALLQSADPAVVRTHPLWRDPVLPDGWTLKGAVAGVDGVDGYQAYYQDAEGHVAVTVDVGRVDISPLPYTLVTSRLSYEVRVIDGHAAVVERSSQIVSIYDEQTGVDYAAQASDPDLRKNIAALIAITRSLYQDGVQLPSFWPADANAAWD
ncbi:MAG: hypothetical protein OXC71_00545 [Chloroflexi bacterium]|nr:hypothetical protein [Chloroflexota bacterium]